MLIKAGGIAIATTTVLGYDWTYDQIEKQALLYKEPGYWAAKWKTIQNPLFLSNPVMRAEIERARKTMTPELFAQEYEAERSNAQGLVYGGALIDANVLKDDEAVKRYVPEWPNVHPSRKVLIGVDPGGDHPFGAVMIVVTEHALVVVQDFLERQKATSQAHDIIASQFLWWRFNDKTFASGKNELQLRLEWALKGTGVVMAENKHEIGIQRVQSWLLTKQLKFAYTVKRTIEQMAAYRYADNTVPSTGEKRDKEKVFKLKDELPDAIRYALMAFPELPDPEKPPMSDAEQARLAAFDEKTRHDLEVLAEMRKARSGTGVDLRPEEPGYPAGNVWQHDEMSPFGVL